VLSLKANAIVNVTSFLSEVYNVYPSPKIFLVALKDRIYGLNPCTFEKEFSLETYPSPVPDQVVALSSRWLGYAGNSPVQYEAKPDKGKLVKIVRDVARGASYLGDLAGKSVSTLLGYPQQDIVDSPQTDTTTNTANAGSVIVHDLCSRKVIAQFYAHALPLSVLSWDPSGTILVTADIECRSFHVYKIKCSPDEITKPHFIYTLRRGVTAALVQDISFSPDGRWVAASSVHGTSHLFAIYPAGGPVYVHTHTPAHTPNRAPDAVGFNSLQATHLELGSYARIKQASIKAQPDVSPKVQFVYTTYTPRSSRPATTTPSPHPHALVCMDGILSLFSITPHAPTGMQSLL